MKAKNKFINYYEIFLYFLAILCFIYYFHHGNVHKTVQPILIISVLFGVKLIIKITHIELHPILRTSILTFIFMAMILAVEFNFYKLFQSYDKILHSLSGILFFFVGLGIFKYINRNVENLQISPLTIVLFSLFFSISIAGCWEIFEFTTDKVFGLNSQKGSLVDTMGDIICGTTGATLTAIYVYLHDTYYIFNYFLQFKQVQADEGENLETSMMVVVIDTNTRTHY